MDYREYFDSKGKANKKDSYFQRDVTSRIMFPTGNLGYDYKNGIYNKIYNDHDVVTATQHMTGSGAGSLNSLIGKSGVGKTTHAIKMGLSNIRPYMKGSPVPGFLDPKSQEMTQTLLHIADVEKTIDMNDVKRITGLPTGLLKRNVKIDPVNNDLDLIKVVTEHIEWKQEHVKPIKYPYKNLFGEDIWDFPPSVLIIDAMTKLSVFETETTGSYESIKSNTSGARKAKVIGDLLGLLVDIAKKYNIIIYNICHINVKPNMSFLPQPKQYKGLKQDETIAGGERQIFLSSNIIRFDHEKEINTEKASHLNYGEGIKGALVRVNIIKTKTNAFGGSTPSILLSHNGIDNIASNLTLAKEMDILGSKGNKFYIPGHADVIFTWKDYSDVLREHPEVLPTLYTMLRKALAPKLSSFDDALKANKKFDQAVLEDRSDFVDASGKSLISKEEENKLSEIYKDLYKSIA